MSATATCTHRIHTGDVIEIDLDEQSVTALIERARDARA